MSGKSKNSSDEEMGDQGEEKEDLNNEDYEYDTYYSPHGYKEMVRTDQGESKHSDDEYEDHTIYLQVPEEYKTLHDAVKQVNRWVSEESKQSTYTIVLEIGTHSVNKTYLDIGTAMNIVGKGKQTVIQGGIRFLPGIQGICYLQNLTLRGAKVDGVLGLSSFKMKDVVVDQCAAGIVVKGCTATCTDVEVMNCNFSGVHAYSASITLINTIVHNNCQAPQYQYSYGLEVTDDSYIRSYQPLENVSFHNPPNVSNRNWNNTNQITQMITTQIQDAARGQVRVMPHYTLEAAVKEVHRDDSLTTIIVGIGTHKYQGQLAITSAMNIVGDPTVSKKEIIIKGFGNEAGIRVDGQLHLQHLTLQSEGHGIMGYSSFTMKDVIVEKCIGNGVAMV